MLLAVSLVGHFVNQAVLTKANREANHQYLQPTKKVYSRGDQWLKIGQEDEYAHQELQGQAVVPHSASKEDPNSGVLR